MIQRARLRSQRGTSSGWILWVLVLSTSPGSLADLYVEQETSANEPDLRSSMRARDGYR